MKPDLEQIALLLQRRYNCIREIGRLTNEAEDAFNRNDHVSASMLLDMRGEEMVKTDACNDKIWSMANGDSDMGRAIHVLMTADPHRPPADADYWEKKIYEIRSSTAAVLEQIRQNDSRMNRRAAGDRSVYKEEKL